jgi:DDE superfamily endonuclease
MSHILQTNPMSNVGGFAKAHKSKCPPLRSVKAPRCLAPYISGPSAATGNGPSGGRPRRFWPSCTNSTNASPEALLIVILDHAKIHKSRAVKRFLKQHTWVVLEHLEPYSPEYNPIERFWQWLKAKVYGATAFDTIEDVLRKIRQLIWHYNEGWLTATIHFDFTLYREIL